MLPKKLAIVILLLVAANLAFAEHLLIETEFGKVKGQQKTVNGVHINNWLGVPYAASPTGNLRWKPPTNPQKWSDVKSASATFNCPEINLVTQDLIGSEKTCLQLNIWVPDVDPRVKPKKPISSVMVYIHGGGNSINSPNNLVTQGSKLAARSAAAGEPVIVASIGYRLAELGFMASPELTAESPNKSSGNYGLLDQMFALKWIKRNIHAFGGSKTTRVVIFGESAGAYNIAALLASPLATGLFDGAILESPYQAFHWKSLSMAEKVGTSCVETVGCQKKDAKDTLACLRALPTLKIVTCNAAATFLTTTTKINIMNVDGYFLKCNPLDALHATAGGSTRCGKLSQAPVMVGASTYEWSLFSGYGLGVTETDLPAAGKAWAQDIIDKFQSKKTVTHDFADLYPLKEYAKIVSMMKHAFPEFSANDAAINDMVGWGDTFVCSALATSSAISVQQSRNAYLYQFDHWPSAPGLFGLTGPTHTTEMPFVFGTFDEFAQQTGVKGWTPTAFEEQLSQTMMDYWLNFGRYLNPNNPSSKATWPVAGYGEKNNFMVFGEGGAVALMGKPYHHHRRCEAWMSYTGLPAILPTKFEWKVDFPQCPRGYWANGCGQPAMKQQGTAKCYASSFFPYKMWRAKDVECTAQKPATQRVCPATKPCPRCIGCKRNGSCFRTCGNKAGKCSKCDSREGRMGACCQRGAKDDPIECKLAEFQFETDKVHTCALLPADMHVGYLLKNVLMRLDDLEDDVEDLQKK